jgi:hypothetical protein
VRLLRQRLLDEAIDMRQAGVRSTRAAGLDRRRVRVEAYVAHTVGHPICPNLLFGRFRLVGLAQCQVKKQVGEKSRINFDVETKQNKTNQLFLKKCFKNAKESEP